MTPYYFDYAATTPLDPHVLEAMLPFMRHDAHFGNPASTHAYGTSARDAIELAREQVAALFNAAPSELIWTSGATEAINLALKGAARLYQRRGKHIITAKTEHKAVLDTCLYLEKDGYKVTYLTPKPNGVIDIAELQDALTPDTFLISIMHVNNETGVLQDLASIANLIADRGILFHVDAAQTPGKARLDITSIPIDLVSLSAHKAYGPKGVGALYLRKKPRIRVEPLLHGGGHEQGMRSGTLPTHQLVGMGAAYAIMQQTMTAELAQITALRDKVLNEIKHISNLILNTDITHAVPHILNCRFDGMIADAILADMPMIAASTASACQGKGIEGSHVLRGMGLTTEQAKSSLRFSFGRFTTDEQVNVLIQQLKNVFKR